MEPNTQFCSKCGLTRPIVEFDSNKRGVLNKTCKLHTKKRQMPSLDVWDDFIEEISHQSRSAQPEILDVKYKFDLDLLPVNFGSYLETIEEGRIDRTALNNAIKQLAEIIWENSGFRFKVNGISSMPYLTHSFSCCQGASRKNNLVPIEERERDRRRMATFECNSKLAMTPSLENRTLDLHMRHTHHMPYEQIQMRSDVLAFVHEHASTQTPSELFHNLKVSGIPGVEQVLQHQVYYQWKQQNKRFWKHDDDQFTSSKILLEKLGDSYRCEIFHEENINALAIYINASIDALKRTTAEVAIDATYGTNNAGMDLYAVLAELDGTGVPMAYLFVKKDRLTGTAPTGATTQILVKFLRPLQERNIAPTFVGCDKDRSEINAIEQVWPLARIQLCYWHAKRAIKLKLKDYSKTNPLAHYWPGEAQSLVPDLEICWGSHPTRRPDQDHKFGYCQCESRGIKFEGYNRLEVSNEEEREAVLVIFSRHFNAHPLIPDQNGFFRTSRDIHHQCTREMYLWCRAKNYFRLWAYLFVNWYRSDQWKLWARSYYLEEIPVLKTTMIVESHWRSIKHDFLHRFNRPRIDMVIWILTSRSIPLGLDRMKAIQVGDQRRALVSWRKVFKRNWKELKSHATNPQSLQKYHTDAAKWTCACDKFLQSRFLLCKHIVSCFDNPKDPVAFFSEIRRQRSHTFWVHPQLSLLPEFESSKKILPARESPTVIHSDFDTESLPELHEDEQLVSSEDERPDAPKLREKLEWLLDEADKQEAHGNPMYKEKLEKDASGLLRAYDDLKKLKNRRTMPRTWSPKKSSSAMYYKFVE